MCDEVFYKTEGEECGVFRKTIGNLETGTYDHHVCSPGLSCFLTKDFQGSDVQQCLTVKKQVGEQCLPDYNHCIFTYGCSKNAYEVYTCDAKDLWKGNIGMDTRKIYRPNYQRNDTLLLLGIIVLCIWFLGIVFFFAKRYKTEHETDEMLLADDDKDVKVLY
jgi:cbb3-type cytochrome oxidase subunit 3